MKEIIDQMNGIIDALKVDLAKAEGNKAAAARARKATIELAKIGKQFRAVSIEAAKK